MPPAKSPTDFGPSTQQFDSAATREALPSGTRLGGYQIIDLLGRGGFGIVYLALDSSLQRQVAIKEYLPSNLATRHEGPQVVLKPGADANAYRQGIASFLNEAKLLARFDHPSLARVHSYWEENGTAYMTMPYYAGHTLAATLASMPRPPDEAWLRAMLTPLLGALSVLHTAQCYHRDISPDNIFMLADGRPVLLDFGAANRVAGDKTMPLTALLNPAYAPIEQYSESATLPQGPWTDLYALAGVLHFAITGQPAARATVRAVEDPQRPLAETVRGLQARFPGLHYSDAFLAGIDMGLSVKPRDRPRNVSDFQQAMDRKPVSVATPLASSLASPPAISPASRQIPAGGTRNEPVFDVPRVREEWFTAGAPSHAAVPSRRGPLWAAGLGMIALVAVGAWWVWMQTQAVPARVVVTAAPPIAIAAPASTPAVTPPADPASAGLPASAVAAAVSASQAMPAASDVATAEAPAASAAPAPAVELPASAVSTVATQPAAEPAAESASSRKAARAARAETVDEGDTPRAVCGSRSNFSLYYCMQTQCKRPRFVQHVQCFELKQRGE
ncbi:MAG: serine/threonine-protein kinase [Rhizobacter sp.]